VFIDDSPGNVEGARGIGMQAVHFRSVDQLREALLGLGLSV
jgi:FMN phosphatase YigB (HAD superfamily)